MKNKKQKKIDKLISVLMFCLKVSVKQDKREAAKKAPN